MFGKRKEKANITPGEPQFHVKYVGNVETYVRSAKGCTSNLVQKIWDNSEEEKKMKKYSMLVIPTGIVLSDVDKKNHELKFDIKNISHYSTEKGAHERVFAWIYHEPEAQRLYCHAVLCAHREKAQQAAIVLSRSLHIAYKDWKGEKIKTERKLFSNVAANPNNLEATKYNFYFPPAPSPSVAPSGGQCGSQSSTPSHSTNVGRDGSQNPNAWIDDDNQRETSTPNGVDEGENNRNDDNYGRRASGQSEASVFSD